MMIASHNLKYVSILFTMMVFTVLVRECSSQRIHASVTNEISEGVELHIHCKSKDTDFGDHTLINGAKFSWNFKINIFVTTLYWCNMSWTNVDGKYVQGSYNMYVARRDWKRCENYCHFYVRKDCVYGYIRKKGAFKCVYSWAR
ncbi:hypothetical protein MKW94_020701 [Papaver nudicaule]|uniref:S-protein homolog n=1 Tax=Papaver nudicaule TaxID=74823 RepID=A0AA41VSS8_PAPNU|nr:hypothetical protein [Papaver nudicaule]